MRKKADVKIILIWPTFNDPSLGDNMMYELLCGLWKKGLTNMAKLEKKTTNYGLAVCTVGCFRANETQTHG